MAVNIKLGSSAFSQEKRISELEGKIIDLEKKLKHYESLNFDYQVRHKEDEKILFELKNIYNLLQIEDKQKSNQIEKLIQEKQKKQQHFDQLHNNYEEIKEKLKEMMNHTSKLENDLSEKSALVEKLQSDLQKSENAQINLEKIIHELSLQREAKLADIRTLQKTIQQKDKFLAVMNKEKEKYENEKTQKENKIQKKQQPKYKSNDIIDGLCEISQGQTLDRLKSKY